MLNTALLAKIESSRGKLTDSDQRVLDVLFRDPALAAVLSASEVAREAGVHPATAVRLAQKLGFDGYTDMRLLLRSDMAVSEASARVASTLSQVEGGSLAALVKSEIETLQGLLGHLTQEAIDAAACAMIKSDRIVITAQGNAVALANLLDRRLRRAGFRSVLALGSDRELAEQLLSLGRHDTLVTLQFRSVRRGVSGALRHARMTGANTILIADQVARRVAEPVDHVLAAPRGREDQYLSLTVPMAICNALVLAVARLDEGRSMRALDALEALTKTLRD